MENQQKKLNTLYNNLYMQRDWERERERGREERERVRERYFPFATECVVSTILLHRPTFEVLLCKFPWLWSAFIRQSIPNTLALTRPDRPPPLPSIFLHSHHRLQQQIKPIKHFILIYNYQYSCDSDIVILIFISLFRYPLESWSNLIPT